MPISSTDGIGVLSNRYGGGTSGGTGILPPASGRSPIPAIVGSTPSETKWYFGDPLATVSMR